MKIDAKVQSISKLKDYFFLVPDYQREYVWKPDNEVEQFLIDIENEYSECESCHSKDKTNSLFYAQSKGYIKIT